jgi:hypothetical protein
MQMLMGDRQELWTRAGKLVGRKVKVQGKLLQAITGYHRTAVMIDVESLEPVDAGGRAALLAPSPKAPPVEDVAAYDILVHAGERLKKEAIEDGSKRQLLPVDAYAPHWVNGGGDILYVNCHDNYDLSSSACSDGTGNGCAIDIPENEEVVRIHCVRRK